MKAGKRRIIAAALVLLLVLTAAALWYTRPVSFAELTPGFDRSAVSEISGTAAPDSGEGPLVSLTFDGNSPLVDKLFVFLDSYTYHRSLFGLLPRPDSGPVRRNCWSIRADDSGGCYFTFEHMSRGMYLSFTAADGSEMEVCVSADMQKLFDAEMHGFLTEIAANI